MTIVLAVFAAFKSIAGAIVGFLAKVPWWVYAGLFILGVGMYLGHGGGTLRDFACSKTPRPPAVRAYDVVSVEAGNRLTVSYGIRDRRQAAVTLYGVSIPEPVADAAKAELERLAGASVNIQEAYAGQRRLGAAEVEQEAAETPSSQAEAIRPPPAIGVVFGAEGCCQELLIKAGWACNTSKEAAWVAAEKAARKSKIGYWAKTKW